MGFIHRVTSVERYFSKPVRVEGESGFSVNVRLFLEPDLEEGRVRCGLICRLCAHALNNLSVSVFLS